MFVFEDIKLLDDRSLREVMREIAQDELILAMRGASDELKNKFYKNMSERNANTVKEELEFMAPTKLSEVEQAQQNIVKIVRRLEAEGKITISRGTGDTFV
jgi:flagellar motor switch protein FliG